MSRAIVANHREVEMRWYRDSETGDLVTGYLLSPAEVASLAEATRTADRPSLRAEPTWIAEARAWHNDDEGHVARKPECLTCQLIREVAALRKTLEGEDQEAALRAGGSLDEAWAEAEAALPEGWEIAQLGRVRVSGLEYTQRWGATAAPVRPKGRGWRAIYEARFADGTNPAPALRALAAALRGPQATEPTGSASTSIDLREGET